MTDKLDHPLFGDRLATCSVCHGNVHQSNQDHRRRCPDCVDDAVYAQRARMDRLEELEREERLIQNKKRRTQ